MVEYGVANTLSGLGNEVSLIGCKGMFLPQCIATNEAKLTFSPEVNSSVKSVCVSCQNRSDLLHGHFSLVDQLSIEDFKNSGDEKIVDNFLASISKDDFLEKKFEGMPVCRIAMYEFALKYKLRSTNFEHEYWAEYLHQLRNVLFTALGFKRALTEVKPDRVVVHNSLYSLNQIACNVAETTGIPSYSIGASQNFSHRQKSFSLFRSPQDWIALSRSNSWHEYSKNRKYPIDIKACDDHFKKIMSGKNPFTYSQGISDKDKDDVRSFFGILESQKICLATLSSEDEYFAAELIGVIPDFSTGAVFVANQYEWLSLLIDFFGKNLDLALIIRVHPREFPNKRDSVTAESVEKLKQLFNNLPSNVKVNWPDDEISIYALADKTDLLLNWRSTVGVEFLALGIPVLVPSCSNLLSYPIELNHLGESALEYEKLILQLVNENWSMTNVYNAYTWMTFLSNFAALPIDSTERAPQKITLLRPTAPGLSLRIWDKLVSNFLTYIPLFLEKRSVKGWSLPIEQVAIINATLQMEAPSLAETILALKNEPDMLSDSDGCLEELTDSLIQRVLMIESDPKRSYILTRMMDSATHSNSWS